MIVVSQGALVIDNTSYVENSEWDLLSTTFNKRLRRRLRRNEIVADSQHIDYCNGRRVNETAESANGISSVECNHLRQTAQDSMTRLRQTDYVDQYTELRYQVHIRRRSFYFAFNVIVPCLMLSVLTLLTFWLPATSNEKVSLGLSVFLTYSMFMLLIAEEVPTTSESVPLIGEISVAIKELGY